MTSLLRQRAEQLACPTCHVQAGEDCKFMMFGRATDSDRGAFHIERYTLAKELYMSSQTQRDLLEAGLITQSEAESPMNDIETLLRAIVRLVSSVAEIEKEIREIRNKV